MKNNKHLLISLFLTISMTFQVFAAIYSNPSANSNNRTGKMMKKIVVLLCLCFSYSVYSKDDIDKYLDLANKYVHSIHNVSCNIITENYLRNTNSSLEKTYQKDIQMINYGFDSKTSSTRSDHIWGSRLNISLINEYCEEFIVRDKKYSSRGFGECLFFHDEITVSLSKDLNRFMYVFNNDQHRVDDEFLKNPFYFTLEFISDQKNLVDTNLIIWDNPAEIIEKEDHLKPDQVLIRKEVIRESKVPWLSADGKPKGIRYYYAKKDYTLNKKFGYVEKIIEYRKQFTKEEYETNKSNLSFFTTQVEKNKEVAIFYNNVNGLPFPEEILYKSYRRFPNEKEYSLDWMRRLYYFDRDINNKDFDVSDIFIYPENGVEIYASPENVKLNNDDYFALFSDLPIKNKKTVYRNLFYNWKN